MSRALASFLVVCSLMNVAASQDVKVREEAVRLLEVAHQVSASPNLPNLERVDLFRAFGSEETREGSFRRMLLQGTGERDEYLFGDYHLVNVWKGDQVAISGASQIVPPELSNVLRITPIQLVFFDGEDVIHSIIARDINGHRSRCIEFDTVRGQRTDNNEICVAVDTGVLLASRLGPELIENDDFFSFAGELIPAKISYTFAGVKKLEITQTMTLLNHPPENLLDAPGGAQMQRPCKTYRRPFGQSMPQPKTGNGGTSVDVIISAMVDASGRVHDASVRRSERPDLNDEALAVAKQWIFTPSLCEGKPKSEEVEFTLHFQGR
ncbi:MAG TPA: TonB family protein [Candidatus Sulfotelmatobacter sp.]